MERFQIFLIGLLLSSILLVSSCRDCKVNPDLVSDLLAPTSNIIEGEPVEWDYVVESVEENSEDCDILSALASIGSTIIDFFTNPDDTEGDEVLNRQANVSELGGGQSRTITNVIDVFNEEGIYFLTVTADDTNVVEERNENNNTDNAEINLRLANPAPVFSNASPAFLEKLESASAIIIVGEGFTDGIIDSYKGKPIYYAE